MTGALSASMNSKCLVISASLVETIVLQSRATAAIISTCIAFTAGETSRLIWLAMVKLGALIAEKCGPKPGEIEKFMKQMT
jgi:hypothetical protein